MKRFAARCWPAGLILMFASAALMVAPQALAHHSYAMFDLKQNVELVGTVKEWQFTNPHSYLQLVVVENGAPVEYTIESGSPNTLVRMGWSRQSFKPGDKITISINPLRDGSKGGRMVQATLPDGKILVLGLPPNPAVAN
jgi:Family of unknown function (DUF6152)